METAWQAAIDDADAGATTFPADHVHTRVMNMISLINTFNGLTLNGGVVPTIRFLYDDATFDAAGLKLRDYLED